MHNMQYFERGKIAVHGLWHADRALFVATTRISTNVLLFFSDYNLAPRAQPRKATRMLFLQ